MNKLSTCPICGEDAPVIDERVSGVDIEVTVECEDCGDQTFCE